MVRSRHRMECGEKARLVEEHHKAAIAYSRAARALAQKREHLLCFRI